MARHTTTESGDVPTSQLTTDPGTGGDVLVALLRELGVEVAFGVISIHNIPLVEAVSRDLRFVPVRHEAAAVNAADGYARATGRIGVALTSTGTGAGNAAGAMLEALTARSRVLHITGNIESQFIGEDRGVYHEVPRQLDMLHAVSGHALRVGKAKHARRILDEAVRLLDTAPHLPVSVDWPIDLQYTADPGKQSRSRPPALDSLQPRPRELAKAARLMSRAKRPLIWAGGGAREVGPVLLELATTWGAGVLTGAAGRGSLPEDHPLCIGNFPLEDAVTELVKDADCLLTVGSHLRAHETANFDLPLPKKHIQIDVDAGGLGRNYPVTVGLHADARVTVPALLEQLTQPRTADDWPDRVHQAGLDARAAHRDGIGLYAEFSDVLRTRLPRNAPLVRDVTIPGSSWGNRLLEVYEPTENIFAVGGGIGQGLAMAVGAGVGRPEVPVAAIVGDGGLAVHFGELATLAGERPHVLLLLFNDGGYGVLRNLQTARQAPHRGVDLFTPDYAATCAAFDLPHRRVADVAGFDQAVEDAVGRPGPSVIEIDVAALTPAPDVLVPPTKAP